MNKTVKPTILAVDDERDMLDTFQAILQKDCQVLTVSGGKEALKSIIQKNVDLVLLDIRLPEMDGIEVLRQIKELEPELEVIMVTALKDVKLAVSSIKLGAYDYINKPFEVEELLALIRKALEKRRLIKENLYLKSVVEEEVGFGDLTGASEPIKEVFALIKKISSTDSTVLITGESGTGKELAARTIHKKSPRAQHPFIAINCAAIPENLLESELFGHERGAFTGAQDRHLGKFELSDKGTIFLDEIGCMPTNMQAKLLRVLQEGEIQRVGGSKPILVDVRIVSATNANLKSFISQNKFREDLFYRLNVIPLAMPPLRERRGDIPILINYFMEKYNKKFNKRVKGLSPEAFSILENYRWPGNVRELQNLMERLVVLEDNEIISTNFFPLDFCEKEPSEIELKDSLKEACRDFEKRYIKMVLKKAGNNQTKAAELLKLHRTTLVSKMESLGITTEGEKSN